MTPNPPIELPPRRRDWPRALGALRVMRQDPERTEQVFEMNVALDGGDSERQYRVFLDEPGAAGLLDERPLLVDALKDFEHLRRLQPDSLGHHYVRTMEAQGYGADGLDRAAGEIPEFAELYPGLERSWFAQRGNCIHDLLHVVTGYGQDPAGETALLAFTDGMYGHRARLFVLRFGLLGSLLSAPRRSILRATAFAWSAWRRGRRSRIPFAYRWEDALPRPLAEVRSEFGIAAPASAHPGGLLRGDLDAPWRLQRA